jgi:two-component system, cell cycle response regulator
MPSEPIQILLVEGDPVNAQRLTQMLRAGGAAGCHLHRAHRLREAKRYLQTGRADVALIALSLPDAHGLDVLIQAQQTAPTVPFLALSETPDDSLATQALQLGAQDFLVKSEINPGQLARALSYAIARQQAQLHLRSLSLMDELTGLHNRRGFISLAEQQLKLTSRQGLRSTLIFIDVDNLKYINDNFGHSEGDFALQQIAALLKECFREADIIGRLGGDEFSVLLSHTGESGEILARKRLVQLVSEKNENLRRPYALSVSLGIADVAGPHELEQQIDRADALMYEHKRTKRFRRERFNRMRELV